MSLWRRTRGEVAGAMRSLRYDLDRRADERPTGAPDVTSTGMNTFGGPVADDLVTGYCDELPRRPRRVLAASAFGLLAVVGGAGSYYAVVHGLDAVLAEKPAAAEAHRYPLVAAAPPAAPSTSGLGRVSRPVAPRTGTVAAAPPTAVGAVPATPRARRTTKVAAPVPPDGITPPVPTPTWFPSATPSESVSPSPSVSASASASSSASPAPSGSDTDEPAARQHRDHRH
jgi:hypothetical protein